MAFEKDQTSTSEMIQHVRRKIWNYRKYFPRLRRESVRLGFLGKTPMMPAVSIVPVSWAIVQRYGNGRYNVGRQIEIQLYASGRDNDEAQKNLGVYADKFYEILTNDEGFLFKDENNQQIAFSFDYEPIIFENEVVNLQRFKARLATITLTMYSKDFRPKQVGKSGKLVPTNDSRIVDDVFRKLQRNKSSRLLGIRDFIRNDTKPKGNGITLSVQRTAINPNRHSSGADLFDFVIPCIIYSKMLAGEKSLLGNLDKAEMVKEIFEEDETFNGIAWNSETSSIEYGIDEVDGNYFYASRVNLLVRKHRSTLKQKSN